MTVRGTAPGHAWRTVGTMECCGVEFDMDEDGDVQDDGSVLWSGCATGVCLTCGQIYADWWEGTFKIGGPTK